MSKSPITPQQRPSQLATTRVSRPWRWSYILPVQHRTETWAALHAASQPTPPAGSKSRGLWSHVS
ncbi:hypothetical protein M3J09_003542 [Ascochyta lentis]